MNGERPERNNEKDHHRNLPFFALLRALSVRRGAGATGAIHGA
jgi:hypothetical protein